MVLVRAVASKDKLAKFTMSELGTIVLFIDYNSREAVGWNTIDDLDSAQATGYWYDGYCRGLESAGVELETIDLVFQVPNPKDYDAVSETIMQELY